MSNYTDLQNNPRLLKIYKQRLGIIKLVRDFFNSQNFVEVDTPIALKYPGQEPYLNPVPVQFSNPIGQTEKFYLQTSPEFGMKKLLAAGFKNIFQICKCFRNSENWGGNHNTEFTMVEWYRTPGELENIMDDTETLFKFIAKSLEIDKIQYKNNNIEIMASWDRKNMKELWQEYLGINLDDYVNDDDQTKNELAELCQKFGYQANKNDQYEDLFYKIFLNKIEPSLGNEKPIIVYDYPASMCSLSKPCEYNDKYAQRFEVYIGGLELANAFGELTNSQVQKNNLNKDSELRKQLNREIWPIDEDFIESLNYINGPAAGIALGIDRMVLLFTGALDLNEVIFQSVNDQVKN